ncbi:hypothetical protein [Actinospica sp.]|uniref:hypothetical protein n=1 Tax=Actinospica sp. TaxID=1872142 RepID=UPI002CFD710B|nr:hypothetical protein [Actinospica sp.]HWG25808.1 hypothetical protein [Actinospica sp.]
MLSAAGLLLFIFSFLPWFSASVDMGILGSASGHANAWSDPSGFIDWFPVLLLLVYGVVLALPAFGVELNVPQLASGVNRAFIGLVLSAFAVLLFAIQGLTYPSLPAGISGSAGPSWGYFVALVIALAAGAQSYLGFTQQGGSLAAVGAGIKARTQQSAAQPEPQSEPQPEPAPFVPPQQQPFQQPEDQAEQPQQQPPAPPVGS